MMDFGGFGSDLRDGDICDTGGNHCFFFESPVAPGPRKMAISELSSEGSDPDLQENNIFCTRAFLRITGCFYESQLGRQLPRVRPAGKRRLPF